MPAAINNDELIVLSFEEFLEHSFCCCSFTALFVIDKEPNHNELMIIIKEALKIGTKYFLSWGMYADDLHDLFDDLIISEQMEKNGVDYVPPLAETIMTTAHSAETAEDVLFFYFNCTGAKSESHKFLILYNDAGKYISELSVALKYYTKVEK